jgi:hypothetical protein
MCSPIGSLTMKKPRVEDFDPKAVPPLASPLDAMPAIQPLTKTTSPSQDTSNASAAHSSQITEQKVGLTRAPDNPSARTPVAPSARTSGRRTITRYAFEFFQDQIETLRHLSLEEKSRGEKGSMSEMVREAVDTYISRRLNREESG